MRFETSSAEAALGEMESERCTRGILRVAILLSTREVSVTSLLCACDEL